LFLLKQLGFTASDTGCEVVTAHFPSLIHLLTYATDQFTTEKTFSFRYFEKS